MILYFGIFLSIILGFFSINTISPRFSLSEKIGLSFPIGMAITVIVMLLLDFVGIPFSPLSLLSAQFVLIAGLLIFCIYYHKKESLYSIVQSLRNFPQGLNLVWLLFVFLILYFEYMNFSKSMYFPPFDRDSLAGFETIGYISAQEHTFKGLSIFDGNYIPSIHAAGSYINYTPLVQLCYAYVYTLGAETSKIIPSLMFLFFLIALYGSAQRIVSKTGSAILTFFTLITPEMIAFSSLSATNDIHMVYASLGIIYLSIYMRERQQKDLYLSSLLLGLNMLCRNEGVVFVGAAMFILAVDAFRKKQYKPTIIGAALMILPFSFWYIFMTANRLYAESIIIAKPFWDTEKIDMILRYMSGLFTTTTYYGWSFYFFFFSLLANLFFIYKKKDSAVLPVAIVLAAVAYMLILYHIDYKWDSIQNVLSFSAKRFLFCFIPLVWYYGFTSYAVQYLLKKLDAILSLKRE